jgi:predicted dehydrogenase
MNYVRLGMVGMGAMGQFHLRYISELQDTRLTGFCDVYSNRLTQAREKFPDVPVFESYDEMFDTGAIDAVLIATPHPQHPPAALAAMRRDIHVLCEKPLASTVAQAMPVIEFHAAKPRLKYAAMFQQRVLPCFAKLRAMIRSGELGEISRLTWIVTDWFRPWSYYKSGSWRATWAGEGGGVLINQCPHNLDLISWLTGLTARRVTALASLGKTHPIETEDEVSAIIEFDGGCVGQFVTTTGEAPGTNLLEIAGDRGVVRVEGDMLVFRKTEGSVKQFRQTSPGAFSSPAVEQIDVALDVPPSNAHQVVTQNFVNSILRDEPLIAPAAEGLRSLELGNAMLMSGLTRSPVELPIDAGAYDQLLARLQKQAAAR